MFEQKMDDFDPREFGLVSHEQWGEEKDDIIEKFQEEKQELVDKIDDYRIEREMDKQNIENALASLPQQKLDTSQ